MIGRRRWISSMKRMSPARRFVSVPTRSPGFSSAGPLVVRMFTPSSRAISSASVVLPSPGGPWKSVWSSGSRRPSAAWMAMSSESFTFGWPMNSASAFGRSESSTTDSSLRTSGVVISARDMRCKLSAFAARRARRESRRPSRPSRRACSSALRTAFSASVVAYPSATSARTASAAAPSGFVAGRPR